MTELAQKIIEIDVRGEVCPFPAMKAVEAMRKAQPGQVVHILVDHAPALDTIPPQARRLGWECRIEAIDALEWRLALTPAPR